MTAPMTSLADVGISLAYAKVAAEFLAIIFRPGPLTTDDVDAFLGMIGCGRDADRRPGDGHVGGCT